MTPIRKSEKYKQKDILISLTTKEKKLPYLPINFNNNNNKELITPIRYANLLSFEIRRGIHGTCGIDR